MDALPICGRRTTGRFAILSGLISAAAFSSGCASSPARSMAKMWDDLPKVRWSMSRDAADEAPDDAEIAANTPDAADESASKFGSSLTSRFKFSTWSTEPNKDQPEEADEKITAAKQHSGPRDPFLEDELGRARVSSQKTDIATNDDTESPKVASHRDRLKAALSDDSRRNREPEVSLADQDRLRVRVEALMVRATELFEQGEMIPAQRTADLAQNLAEECGLEFSPDDERPVDLLARIDARLEAEAAEAALTRASDKPPTNSAEESADFLEDRSLDFDPYVDRRMLPKAKRTSIFDSSLVVLEAPSFEEAANEPAVSPTAYAPDADLSHASLAFTRAGAAATAPAGEVERAPAPPEIATPDEPEAGQAPAIDGPSFGEIDMPSMEDDIPPPRAVSRTRTAGTVSLKDIDEEHDEAEPAEEIRPAETIPRWVLLSCLSIFAGAFSVWLLRRHVQGAV